ncbi:MAG: DUF2634 domain-containing protein [Eubacteriales bacterium]|nr:DUF2634 domain-containing protein [Eubacteriales bacterium]
MIPKQMLEIEGLNAEGTVQSSKTYAMNKTGRISGSITELEAVKQFIHKTLSTEQGRYYIYDEYGIAVEDLLGKEKDYVFFELSRRIKECLERDERIVTVKEFKELETTERDALAVSFFVETIYGNINREEVFHLAR